MINLLNPAESCEQDLLLMGDPSDACNLALYKHKIHAIFMGKRVRATASADPEWKGLRRSESILDRSGTDQRVSSVKRLWVTGLIGCVHSLESFGSRQVYHFSLGC
jgi:hypothetical protein